MVQSQEPPVFHLNPEIQRTAKGKTLFSQALQFHYLGSGSLRTASTECLPCPCRSAGLQLLQPPDEEDEPELPQWRCYGHALCQHALPHPGESALGAAEGAQGVAQAQDSPGATGKGKSSKGGFRCDLRAGQEEL